MQALPQTLPGVDRHMVVHAYTDACPVTSAGLLVRQAAGPTARTGA